MIDIARAAGLLLLASAALLQGCERARGSSARFRLLDADRTGIAFANTITPSAEHDFSRDPFIYNGAGVAIGDVNGDGRPDIYLTGNMVSSRLYLNRGDFRFEDVTEASGVGTTRWATGASMADVDGDRDLDIYVSVSGPEWSDPQERRNLLFLNQGNGTFTEAAAAYGVADTGFTTHSVFLDYDRDGDLDLYTLGNSPGEFGRGETGGPQFGSAGANPAGFDQLYRNERNGRFTNVSDVAGILRQLGYGLGVVATDLNRDGWTDLYVSNDIGPPDVLYVNNRDGTFTDRAAEWLGHTSFAGMGLDIADYTNDGWPDILQADMMPEDLAARKRVSGSTTEADLERARGRGAPQYNLNSLQLSRGATGDGRVVFSEIGRLAGVAYTDWSWSVLFGDYDNDGLKDVFITNGYPKAVTDFDYQSNTRMARRINDERTSLQLMREMLDTLHAYDVPNYAFRNEGDLTFSNRGREWRLADAGYSYGAAYSDLNDDGRLDLVVNNLDGPAFVYENVAPRGQERSFLLISLEGEGSNTRGIGAKLVLHAGGTRQYVDHTPYRGYMSTVDDRVHFGLGSAARVDSLEVFWPDGRYQRLTGIDAGQRITVRQREAGARAPAAGAMRRSPFEPIDSGWAPRHLHLAGSARFDYSLQPLLPYELSRQGPPLAVADVDGDGWEDVFVGGGGGAPGRLFLQRAGGGFAESPHAQPWAADAGQTDWGALFFDADGDGRPDLYVASGGYTHAPGSRALQDRLYLNRGGGRFEKAVDALPEMPTSTAAVQAADFTGDGRLDLFVGGRLTPGDYPRPTRSYLLRNDGARFTDVTSEVAPQLIEPGGMVTDAAWMDFDGDGAVDLVTAGIWMPIGFHRNEGGRLRDVTEDTGLPPTRGWWYRLRSGDLDGDGDLDLVAGNLGLNHGYTTTPDSPFGVYAADFDDNRITDVVFTREVGGTEYPFYGLALLGRAMDPLAVRYLTFESFAAESMEEIFGEDRLENALHYEADTFASVWLRNDGGGAFTVRELPKTAQIAPIQAILIDDADGDGTTDLLVAGNLHGTEPNTAPVDAGKGLWLRGDGDGGFTPVSPTASGFLASGDVRDLASIRTRSGKAVLVATYGDSLRMFGVGR